MKKYISFLIFSIIGILYQTDQLKIYKQLIYFFNLLIIQHYHIISFTIYIQKVLQTLIKEQYIYLAKYRGKLFMQEQFVTEISDMEVPELDKSIFKAIDFRKYPPHRTHFLIHAVQNHYKPPSQAAMARSQRRNQFKSGKLKVDKVKGRTVLTLISHMRGKKTKFIVPQKRSSLPLVTNKKPQMKPATKKKAYKVRSPIQVLMKSMRSKCILNFQTWRKLQHPNILNAQNDIPLYFRKKKASQKRRRQQKHLLIKRNRKALLNIYGEVIFKRGWPVSRKQIKDALGIKQEDYLINSMRGLASLLKSGSKGKPRTLEKPKVQQKDTLFYGKRQTIINQGQKHVDNYFPSKGASLYQQAQQAHKIASSTVIPIRRDPRFQKCKKRF